MYGLFSASRIEFWIDPRVWPQRSPTHYFLGLVVHMIGRAIHGDAWTGNEPATELVDPLPETLHASVEPTEIRRACRLLYDNDAEYKSGCPDYVFVTQHWPIPTPEKWASAVKMALALNNSRFQEFSRFTDVVNQLVFAFRDGRLKSATRPYDGGEKLPQGQSFWYTENLWGRFCTCQVDPTAPFSHREIRVGGDYIFVEVESTHALLKSLTGKSAGTEAPAATDSEYLSPYLRCMIAGTKALGITENDTRKKQSIIVELPKHWPAAREQLSEADLNHMATLMREPQHKGGRRFKKRS